jgi:hypothetical protein
MNKIMGLQLSPLYPLKGKIASAISRNNFVAITPPTGGQGVSKCINKLFQ